ncbi:MAG: DNA repair protein RadC [Planctomycetota bacterium]
MNGPSPTPGALAPRTQAPDPGTLDPSSAEPSVPELSVPEPSVPGRSVRRAEGPPSQGPGPAPAWADGRLHAAVHVLLATGAGSAAGSEAGPERTLVALRRIGLARAARLPAADLAAHLDVPAAAAARLEAAFALGREVERSRAPDGPLLMRPDAVARLVAPDLRGLEVETFHTLLLDARHRLRARRTVAQGTLTSAQVHPREVFAPALLLRAAALVVVHNHPSGDPEPSAADLDVTRRLVSTGRLVGIPLVDHVIWADGAWVSLRERGRIRDP